MFKLVTGPINFQLEYESIQKPEYGCVLFFMGVSRNAIEDSGIKALEYFAYGEMAINQANKIELKMKEKYPFGDLVIIHRLGVVPVKDISLLVILGSGHRKQMFDALEETVELIKKDLPIWKKAIYENGETLWLNNHF